MTTNSSRGVFGWATVALLCLAAVQAWPQGEKKKERGVPSLEETLAWMKKLPPLGKPAENPYAKLTVDDLKALKDFSHGGHTAQGPHVSTRGSEFRFLTALPRLEKLDLMENDGVDDEALSHIGRIKSLTHVTLGGGGAQITGAGLRHLENLKELTELIMPGSCKTGDLNAGLGSLAALPKLEVLHLGNDKIADQGLALLAKATKLKELRLPMNPGITDRGLLSLQALKSLRRVALDGGTKVTPQGIAQLRKQLPECVVTTD